MSGRWNDFLKGNENFVFSPHFHIHCRGRRQRSSSRTSTCFGEFWNLQEHWKISQRHIGNRPSKKTYISNRKKKKDMKRKSDNDERLSPALEKLEKRRKRSRSNSSDEKMVELNRSNSNELDASEFDEMWNDDGANADDSLIEMKTEDQKPTYSSLRSFLKRNQTAFNRHPGRKAQGRKAPYVFFKTFTLTQIFNTLNIQPTYM